MAISIAAGCNGQLQVYGFGIVLVLGSFALNGSSSPVAANNKGKGFSVVRTSAGLFTITFVNSAISVLSAWSTLQCVGTTVDLYPQFGTIDVVTNLTAVIQMKTGATNTDPPAADANSRCHFGFYMATSGLTS